MKYYGWVPTVAGRLSFTFIGSGSERRNGRWWADDPVFLTEFGDPHVVFYHDLWTGDSAFRIRSPWEYRINRIVFIGKKPDTISVDACLRGAIFSIVPNDWKPEYSTLQPHDLTEELKSTCQIYAPFELYRDGIVVFETPTIRVDPRSIDPAADRETALNRMYCLLKDFVHVHQHHHADTDEIIFLKKVDGDGLDFVWARKIAFELYRYIVGLKREKRNPDLDFTNPHFSP